MPHRRFLTSSTVGLGDRLLQPFSCTWSDGGEGAAWLRATGELDFASTPQFEQSLQDAQLQARLVVLDLRDLTFIDSAGVRAVVEASRRARLRAHRLIVVRGPAAVDFVFDLTGSSGELTILDLGPAEPPVMALLELAQERTTQVG